MSHRSLIYNRTIGSCCFIIHNPKLLLTIDQIFTILHSRILFDYVLKWCGIYLSWYHLFLSTIFGRKLFLPKQMFYRNARTNSQLQRLKYETRRQHNTCRTFSTSLHRSWLLDRLIYNLLSVRNNVHGQCTRCCTYV
jgi:hypothetical protein